MMPVKQRPQKPLSRMILEKRVYSTRSLLAGLVCTLFLHLALFFLIPPNVLKLEKGEVVNRFKEYQIELENPDELDPAFTQTNPDAPENEPDSNDFIGARNQQAANEEKPEEIDPENRPTSRSDDAIETTQFVTGDLSQPELAPPPSPAQEQVDSPEEEAEEQQALLQPLPQSLPLQEQVPTPSEEEEVDPEGIAAAERIVDPDKAPTNILEDIKGLEEEGESDKELQPLIALYSEAQSAQQQSQAKSDPSPRPRPRLPKVPPGPVRDHKPGVSNVGTIGVDSKFSEFGEYLERLIETVSVRWTYLANESSARETLTMAKLRFTLTKDGRVEDLHLVDGTAKAIGIYVCRTAIESGSPYGPWTAEMIQVLGDEEEITFTFHYR